MKQNIKKLWVKALLSGKYKQGKKKGLKALYKYLGEHLEVDGMTNSELKKWLNKKDLSKLDKNLRGITISKFKNKEMVIPVNDIMHAISPESWSWD